MAKILILTSRWPWPPHGGDRLRILEICRELSREHELTLIACTESANIIRSEDEKLFSKVEVVFLPKWRSYLNCLIALFSTRPLQLAYYYSRKYSRLVARYEADADIVIAHLIRTAQYVRHDRRMRILDMTDAVSLVLERAMRPGKTKRFLRLVYRFERSRVQRYEKKCLEEFQYVSVVSEVDRQHLIDSLPDFAEKLLVTPLGVKYRHRFDAGHGGNEILFFGNINTLPNMDACDYFIRECLPIIIKKLPHVVFRVVGPISSSVSKRLSRESGAVVVMGEVRDLEECITQAFCGVAPMRMGAGIQTKILDYMSFGLPCVTTALGYEGLKARIDNDIIVANSPEQIADAIVALYRDEDLRCKMGTKGREYVRQQHSWAYCLSSLKKVISVPLS